MLPKPRIIPISSPSAGTPEGRDSFAVINATAYTASAVYETYKVNTQILIGVNMLNLSFQKLLAWMSDDRQRNDNRNEENDMDRRPRDEVPPVAPGESAMAELVASIKALVFGSVALIAATVITMLDETKKKFVKDLTATTLAITAFSKNLKEDSLKLFGKLTSAIRSIFNVENILKEVRYLYISLEIGLSRIKELRNIDWIDNVVSIFEEIGKPIAKFAEYVKSMRIFAAFEKIGTVLKSVMEPIGKVVSFVSGIVANVVKGISVLAESGVVKILTKIAPIFEKFLIKLLWPIQLVLSIVDFIDGFMKGYAQEGFLEGVKQGLVSVFNGFFGGIVDLAKGIITWVLEAIGLKETAANFGASVDEIWEGIKKTFESLLDIFKGILSLDVGLIWKGVIGTSEGLVDFVINSIKGIFGLITGLFKDITGVDIEAKITGVLNWFTTEFVQIIKDLYQTIIDGLMGAARSVVESLPGGETLANKMFGARAATQEEIEARAKEIAQEKAVSNMTWGEWANPFGDRSEVQNPKVTPDIMEQARKELIEQGYKLGNANDPVHNLKSQDQSAIQNAGRLKEVEKKETNSSPTVLATTVNNNNGGGGTRIAPVVNFQTTDKASHATPANRYGKR